MKRIIFCFSILAVLPGCLQNHLRDKTTTLATTTSDLLYQQVLDNLAKQFDNPAALPYFDLPAQGTAQLQATVQASYTPSWDFITAAGVFLGRYLFDKQSAAIQGQYACQESWQILPLNNPDHLYLLQCAFRRALNAESAESYKTLELYYSLRNTIQNSKINRPTVIPKDPDFSKPPKGDDEPDRRNDGSQVKIDIDIRHVSETLGKPPSGGGVQPLPLKIDYKSFVSSGWFGVGTKREVPKKGVCYIGRHCNTYVWVTNENVDDLTRFTLAILDIATPFTIDPSTGQAVRQASPFGGLPPPPAAPR